MVVQVVDGVLQSDDTGDAWVLRARSWKHLERSIGAACPTIGQGLCSQILTALQRTSTYGRPNLMYEPVQHLGGDFFTVNKMWIATVTNRSPDVLNLLSKFAITGIL